MDYRHVKNPLNFGPDPALSGQAAAILDFCYIVLYMDHMLAAYGGAAWRIFSAHCSERCRLIDEQMRHLYHMSLLS